MKPFVQQHWDREGQVTPDKLRGRLAERSPKFNVFRVSSIQILMTTMMKIMSMG
jgi:hypothetical protein